MLLRKKEIFYFYKEGRLIWKIPAFLTGLWKLSNLQTKNCKLKLFISLTSWAFKTINCARNPKQNRLETWYWSQITITFIFKHNLKWRNWLAYWISRDVALLGDCDDGCKTLCNLLNWKQDYESMVKKEHARIDAQKKKPSSSA